LSIYTTSIEGIRTGFGALGREQLSDASFLEKFFIPALGLNDEQLHEQPPELAALFGGGFGLRIFQYPNQFSKYLAFLADFTQPLRSYLEIGCRHGGTFITTTELLNQVNTNFEIAVALDLIPETSLLSEYRRSSPAIVEYLQLNSLTPDFELYLDGKLFDLVLIDGDHSYEAVKSDAMKTFAISNMQVFHDISSDACPGVSQYWHEYKSRFSSTHNFIEFTDQYESVSGNFLGIGVAVRKEWLGI
jgi:hypothetical protein